MTPKEKAKELFDKFVDLSGIFVGDYESEKSMCLIAVDLLLDEKSFLISIPQQDKKYWEQVKQEIENL